jgi:hypothetical protein
MKPQVREAHAVEMNAVKVMERIARREPPKVAKRLAQIQFANAIMC